MNLHNNYMENLRKSKEVVLELLDDTKEIFDGIFMDASPIDDITRRKKKELTPSSSSDIYLQPYTSKQDMKQIEYVKYDKITFDTTAILHHYPQNCKKNKPLLSKTCDVRSEKSTTENVTQNKSKDHLENNNQNVKEMKTDLSQNMDLNLTNNNDSIVKVNCVVEDDNTVTVLQNLKIIEEKLV